MSGTDSKRWQDPRRRRKRKNWHCPGLQRPARRMLSVLIEHLQANWFTIMKWCCGAQSSVIRPFSGNPTDRGRPYSGHRCVRGIEALQVPPENIAWDIILSSIMDRMRKSISLDCHPEELYRLASSGLDAQSAVSHSDYFQNLGVL